MGFLQDDQGNNSCMRLMCILALVAAMVFGALTILRPGSDVGLYLTLLFLLAAFAPKVLQKAIEQKLSLATKEDTHA